jgi:V8-like Glu-specific endopeptidase
MASTSAASASANLDSIRSRITTNVRPNQTYQNVNEINNFVVPDRSYSGVGGLFIETSAGGFTCTGSLIGPSLVLTASHRLATAPGETVNRIRFFLPSFLNENGTTAGREVLTASGFALHPDYNFLQV